MNSPDEEPAARRLWIRGWMTCLLAAPPTPPVADQVQRSGGTVAAAPTNCQSATPNDYENLGRLWPSPQDLFNRTCLACDCCQFDIASIGAATA